MSKRFSTAIFISTLAAYFAGDLSAQETHLVPVEKEAQLQFTIPDAKKVRAISITPGGPKLVNTLVIPNTLTQSKLSKDLLWGVESKTNLVAYKINTDLKQVLKKSFTHTIQILSTEKEGIYFLSEGEIFYFDLYSKQAKRIIHANSKSLLLSSSESVICILDNGTLRLVEKKGRTHSLPKFSKAPKVHATDQGCLVSDQQGWLRFFDRESHSSGYITQSEIQQISVNQNLIHLAHGSAGYSIYEVSAKEGPLWKGSYNKLKNIQTLDVENEHSIVADEHGTLSYFDISGPDDPLLVSEFVLKHPVQQIALVDRHVIAQHDSTLSVIDFSHQSTPTISNLGVNLGGSRRSFLVDHILYVADWFAGVHIYDVSQATRPMHLSSYHTPGSPKGVVVKNGIAYIADDDWGLHIIDVKDPRHPKKVAQLALDGLAYTMQLRQNILFLASHRGGLHIIDIGNPAQPKLLSTYNSPGKTWALALKDDLAFLADDNSGVIVLDIRDLHSPKAMHQYDTGGHAEDILLKDNIAYVAYFDQGVQILDISDVTNFKLLSHIPSPENARDVELHGNQLFVANWYGGVGVYEIADLRKPRHIGRYDTDGATWGIQLDLPHVYALDWWGGVKVLDFSASRKPQEVARYQGDGIAGSLALEGNYAFVANPNRGLDVFDIKNTLNPVWTTAVEIDGGVSTLLAKDGLVFALNGSSNLYIADISDPFHAKKMEDISLAHAGKSLSADLSSIYISDNKGHISALELKNLTRPQKIASQHSDCVLASAEMPLLSCEQGKKVYLIDKLTLKPVAITGSKFVKTDRGLLAYQENVGFTLFDLNQDKATTKKQIPHPSPILDFVANNDSLYAIEKGNQLVKISLGAVNATTYFQSSSNLHTLAINTAGLFFGGETRLVSMELLPELNFTRASNDELSITVPKGLAIGSYDLHFHDAAGNVINLDNAFEVGFPKPKKPKFTLEDLKKILEKKDFKGKAP